MQVRLKDNFSNYSKSCICVYGKNKKKKQKKTDQIGVPLNESYLVYEETGFLTVFN